MRLAKYVLIAGIGLSAVRASDALGCSQRVGPDYPRLVAKADAVLLVRVDGFEEAFVDLQDLAEMDAALARPIDAPVEGWAKPGFFSRLLRRISGNPSRIVRATVVTALRGGPAVGRRLAFFGVEAVREENRRILGCYPVSYALGEQYLLLVRRGVLYWQDMPFTNRWVSGPGDLWIQEVLRFMKPQDREL